MKKEKNYQRRGIELCLCSDCASPLFHSRHSKIYRADQLQVRMEMCDCCRTKRGYNFIIAPNDR